MVKKVIYMVEDERHIQELVKFNLEANGYKVNTYDKGISMLNDCNNNIPAMFILDLMLPDIDGLEICRRIRQDPRLSNIPIIMLTAKTEEFDKILGLELGADDYITKPFSVRELVTRVKVIFRRMEKINDSVNEAIKIGDLIFDEARRQVHKSGKLLDLTFKEFELLKVLIYNKGKVLSRDKLLDKVWDFSYAGETRTVDVHIRYLRQKIEDDDNNPYYIETIRGIGYRFREINEKNKGDIGYES